MNIVNQSFNIIEPNKVRFITDFKTGTILQTLASICSMRVEVIDTDIEYISPNSDIKPGEYTLTKIKKKSKYDKNDTYDIPAFSCNGKIKAFPQWSVTRHPLNSYLDELIRCKILYEHLLECNWPKEFARLILPQSTKIEFIVEGDNLQWISFFTCSKHSTMYMISLISKLKKQMELQNVDPKSK